MGENFRLAREIAQIAARQLGNVTRAQLLAVGLDDAAIHRWVRLGLIHRLHRGVYAVGRPPTTPQEHAAAAVLACGPGAALSHSSAMTLWGFWKRWDRPLHVTVKTDRRPKGIKTHRTTGLLRRDLRIWQGIRVTSPARTLLDAAPNMPLRSLTRRVNDARREGLLQLEQLADVVVRFSLHPGAPLLRPHAGATQNATASGFEDEFVLFCRRFRLPEPKLNTRITSFEVDVFFEEERLIVELDGWDFHSSRDAFEDDRERDATMLALGIGTVRITWERFHREPEREAARLHSILAARRRDAT